MRPCTFCRTDLRVTLCGEVKVWEDRSRSESESEEGEKLHDADPNRLERRSEEGERPVGESEDREQVPEYRGTREILWEAGGTTPQA